MDQALRCLAASPDAEPRVVFLGPPCRTWYDDLDVLQAVMEILASTRPYVAVHGGFLPFDGYVEKLADIVGVPNLLIGPSLGERLCPGYRRNAVMLHGAAMVVAFPVEEHTAKKRHDFTTAAPECTNWVIDLGLPVLSVYRSGETSWIDLGAGAK